MSKNENKLKINPGKKYSLAGPVVTPIFKLVRFSFQGIDVKSMGRIFIGLVKCGAWGCFDEFNRLEEAVLSAVSMQIQVIQDAIKRKAPTAELLSRTVSSTNIYLMDFKCM